ncbi:MAG TPA: response regulator [Anaeromyxobacteraceae bacterium]|nr:response regulator [Anaeromyxobacteraceae bacterium]
MTPKRILIVEPDAPFALSVASFFREEGHATGVAVSAAEAELEIATRRPDLVVMRAELPDLSGFSLCAHLRHDKATARLPLIVYSSDTAPASLAEHARTPWAASGYLAMPLDTMALTTMARRLLAAAEPVELADDAILEDVEPVEAAPAPAPTPPPAPEEPASPAPPLPRRPRRDALAEEDRLFVDRVFQSVADRRDLLAAEAERRRPPPRRDLLATPEGRLTLLREDLKWREAQLARLSEIWEIREREVASVDERIHAKDVEVQRARLEADELGRRLAQAQEQLVEKDREHGASIEGLLLEKFKDEKELIEVVAGTERRVAEQARELRSRDDRIARQEAEAAAAAERIAALEGEGREARARVAALEGQVEGLDRGLREAAERLADLTEQVEARDELLRAARREVDRLQAELSAARQALMLRETELRADVSRARSDAEELASMLAQTTRERDDALARCLALTDDLAAHKAEGRALGEEIEALRPKLDAAVAELVAARAPAVVPAAEEAVAPAPVAALEAAAATPETAAPEAAPEQASGRAEPE